MKDFLKNVLATVVGILIFIMVMGIIGAMSLVGMVAASSATTDVKDNSVLVMNLNGLMSERNEEDPTAMLFGLGKGGVMGLDDVVNAIKKAKDNDKIKGIYIEAGRFASDAPATTLALRKAFLDFKKSGKWIVA